MSNQMCPHQMATDRPCKFFNAPVCEKAHVHVHNCEHCPAPKARDEAAAEKPVPEWLRNIPRYNKNGIPFDDGDFVLRSDVLAAAPGPVRVSKAEYYSAIFFFNIWDFLRKHGVDVVD